MNTLVTEEAALILDRAQRTGLAVDQFGSYLDLVQAYAVQARTLELRTERGEVATGRKLGFTSEAKMAQMGVSELIVGYLTDSMRVEEGGTLSLDGLVHPRVEPEIAFRLGTDVPAGSDVYDLMGAIDAVAPALEIIDSRYRDFRFSLPDVVADNTSACRYVIGSWQGMDNDVSNLPVSLKIDGTAVAEGSTSDILGDPLRTIPRLAAMSRTYGFDLHAGAIILAGAATAAVPLVAGSRVESFIDGLGSVRLHVKGA